MKNDKQTIVTSIIMTIKEKITFSLVGFLAGALIAGLFLQLFVIQNLKFKNARLASVVEDVVPVQNEVFSLTGTVQSVENNSIVLEADSGQFPLEDVPAQRRVAITDETEFVRYEELSFEEQERLEQEYQQALAEFEQRRQEAEESDIPLNPGEEPTPPDLVREVPISLNNISVGDSVTVDAGENIKTKEEFTALRVVVDIVPPGVEEGPGLPLPDPDAQEGADPQDVGI